MNTSNGYDRLATQEELHQVLEILGDLERIERMFQGDSPGLQTDTVWADAFAGDSNDATFLPEPIEKVPELKN
jgi:hypothetical protein